MSDKKNILAVDDDPEVISLLRLLIPTLGYNVFTASDGEEGLAKIRELRPDLVCLDVDMPKKSGVEVLIEMRRDPALSRIPVVMATAQKFDAAFPAFMQEYPNLRGFLGKPFTAAEITKLISKALSVSIAATPKEPRFRTILIAEDDAAFLQQVNLAISGDKTQVSVAQNGAQAIELLRKSIPELVVLDAVMPRFTGIEVLRALRADAVRSQIPALLLTDFQMKPKDVAILKTDFPNLRQVLEKPLTPESLLTVIEGLPRSAS